MSSPPNIYDLAIDEALDLALRDGTVDDAERDHLERLTDMRNRAMAVSAVLTNWTGVPRSIERAKPAWLPRLLKATGQKRRSA